VQPPFPAPPVEGKGRRIGMALGIAAGVLVLVCGGGLAAVIGLGTSASKALDERAHKAVSQYLDALVARDYNRAYKQLCRQARDDETFLQYRARVTASEPIVRYTIGKLNVTNVTVPVDATYDNGDTGRLEAYLGQNQDTGDFEVCDLGE
jgi:hypothetical protein